MQAISPSAFPKLFVLLIAVFLSSNSLVIAQSRPQKGDPPKTDGKKNDRPKPKTDAELKAEEEKRKQEEADKTAEVDTEILDIKTNVVNVDAVVYNKKTGQIITGLKKENFAVFENGVKQEISNFSTPEAPITVTVVLDYSRLAATLGQASGGYFEQGKMELVRPVAYFLSKFIKPPDDYASVIAFDIRPTPLTDFTNDPSRINNVISLLLRNNPAFTDSNMFDALKLALVGGKADAIVLEDTKERTMNYGGMVDVKAKRRAIILVSTGIDSMSKINYGEMRKIIQNSGIPIYIVGTGEMFLKLYENQLEAVDSISGFPGRLTFLQAKNTLTTFAKESGGTYSPVTFPSEIPGVLNNINTLLRNQYNIAYDITEAREPGKKYNLDVKVDINGDGVYEEKGYVIQHRPFYTTPKDEKSEKGKK